VIHCRCGSCGKLIPVDRKQLGEYCTCPSCGGDTVVSELIVTQSFWERILWGLLKLLAVFVGWMVVIAISLMFVHPVSEGANHHPIYCPCFAIWLSLIYFALLVVWSQYRKWKRKRRDETVR
jgi:hypothetical protein